MVMHYSVQLAKVTGNLIPCKSSPRENAKLNCIEISTLQNRQIKMQLNTVFYSITSYTLWICCNHKQI